MSKQVLLVNPRRRSRKRRTTAQKAATRKMIAANRRRSPKRRRRRNPAARSTLGKYVSNPRRRRRSPTRARRRTYRRNPTMRGMVNSLVIPAATAGAGAVALDVLWGFVPIPEPIKSGPMRHVAKGLGAVVLGNLVGMVANKRMGDTMALGALTVVFHTAFREMTAQFAPQIPLGYYSAGQTAGADPRLGMYIESPRMVTRGGESHAANNMSPEMGYYVQEGVNAQY